MPTVRILEKVVLPDTTDGTIALAVHNDRLWLGWIGQNNNQLNVMGGETTPHSVNFDQRLKQVMGDISPVGCALHSFNGRLWIGWTGQNNLQLNVMGSINGNDFDTGTKQVMGDTSESAPALAAFSNRLWISWQGLQNHQLNVMGSVNGNDFDSNTKQVMGDRSQRSPALGPFVGGGLCMCWTGTDDQINLMTSKNGNDFDSTTRVVLGDAGPAPEGAGLDLFVSQWIAFSTPNGPRLIKVNQGPDGVTSEVAPIIGSESFFGPPAMVNFHGQVVIAWAGTDDDHHLNAGFLELF
jgi:hypothetical protein